MKQIFFVRQGEASYRNDRLTPNGEKQVEALSGYLESYLPATLEAILVSSQAGRALDTGRGLAKMLERKTGRNAYLDEERMLNQEYSMGSDETILKNGRRNLALLDKYDASPYGFFVSHEKLIVATSRAILEKYAIAIPEFLQLNEWPPDEDVIIDIMEICSCRREEVIPRMKANGWKPVFDLPRMREASAVHIDLENKTALYIRR